MKISLCFLGAGFIVYLLINVNFIKKKARYFLYEREDLVENDPNSKANINKELSENFIKSKTCRGQK